MIIMTKFAKKISKEDRYLENGVVLGCAFGHLEEISEIFKTIFILSIGINDFKGRNIVYREDFDDVKALPFISTVFIDESQLPNIVKSEEILKKFKSTIYIGTTNELDSYSLKFLKKRNYQCSSIEKKYQIWKAKK